MNLNIFDDTITNNAYVIKGYTSQKNLKLFLFVYTSRGKKHLDSFQYY